VRLHSAQEEDIYQEAVADWDAEVKSRGSGQTGAIGKGDVAAHG
jgi:hypothetical protein